MERIVYFLFKPAGYVDLCMKRNMDIIRGLLLALERDDDNPPELSKYPPKELAYHSALLIEAGLAEGAIANGGFNEIMRADLDRLTWAGHDFIEAARDDTLWKKAKEKVMKPGAAFTFEIVKEWLKSEIRTHFGLQEST
jgi:hypothetical protein